MSSPLSRSFLFVPASRPERFDKAVASGAHQVILDLEDAVAPADKGAARGFIAQWTGRTDAIVRVNGADSPFFAADMDMIRRAGVTRPMLPKAAPGALNRLVGLLERSCEIIALIETVRGYSELRSIGKSRLVSQLAFGNLDFGIDAGVTETAQELDPVRLQIVLESRLGQIGAADRRRYDLVDGSCGLWRGGRPFQSARLWRQALHPSGPGQTGQRCLPPHGR